MSFPKPSDYPIWVRLLVVLFVLNITFFIAPLAAFLTWIPGIITVNQAIAAVGTLVASFAGAWFAFTFAKVQRDRERIDADVAAGNIALFVLSEMWSELRQHQIEVVEPNRGKTDVWLNLPESQPLTESLSFDMKALSFVLQFDAPTFQQLLLEQRRFQQDAYMIEQHRSILVSIVNPRLEAAGLRVGEGRPLAEFERIVGSGTARRLKLLTAAIIENFDDNVKTSREAFIRLRSVLKMIYPDRKFIDLNPNN